MSKEPTKDPAAVTYYVYRTGKLRFFRNHRDNRDGDRPAWRKCEFQFKTFHMKTLLNDRNFLKLAAVSVILPIGVIWYGVTKPEAPYQP